MKYLAILSLSAALCGTSANAQEIEIAVPNGWEATESGIIKGNSELSVGPVLDLGELSAAEYLKRLAEVPFENGDIVSIAEVEEGPAVVQVVREVTQDGNDAKSILFICKDGQNKNRLLELFTDDVFAVISGGKAAIKFCSSS